MRRVSSLALLGALIAVGFALRLGAAESPAATTPPAAPAPASASPAQPPAEPSCAAPAADPDAQSRNGDERRRTCLCTASYCLKYGVRCDWSSTCTNACQDNKCDYSQDTCYCDTSCEIPEGNFPTPNPGARCGALPHGDCL